MFFTFMFFALECFCRCINETICLIEGWGARQGFTALYLTDVVFEHVSVFLYMCMKCTYFCQTTVIFHVVTITQTAFFCFVLFFLVIHIGCIWTLHLKQLSSAYLC